MTYYFYWYDAETGAHLRPEDGLPMRPAPEPPPSWRSVEWHKKQLLDMTYAGIDVVLPVYWGFDPSRAWSTEGLKYLAAAREEMISKGQAAPLVGMFFDTSILTGMDLTTPPGMEFFYANIREFFSRIPRRDWALVDSRPVVWLYARTAARVEPALFTFMSERFAADFGVRPYIVRELSWDCSIESATANSLVQDCSKRFSSDATYPWGAALYGYDDRGTVAAVGPGYDESQIGGRSGKTQSRDSGHWYASNFEKAIASGKSMLVIETWNEFHEATAIAESIEYGRKYLEQTRGLVSLVKSGAGRALTRVKRRGPFVCETTYRGVR